MRIALFSDSYSPDINGIATSLNSLFQALKNNGEEVLLITSNSLKGNKSEYDKDLIRLKGVRFKKIYNYVISLFADRKTIKMLKEFKPDICHIHTDGPLGQFGFRMAKKLKAKTIYTLHTSIEDYTHYVTGGKFFDKSAKKLVRRYLRNKIAKTDALIVPSKKTADYLKSIGITSLSHIVPTGFDYSLFKDVDEIKIKELRSLLNLAENDYIVLYLGRLAKEKSVDFLIEGFEEYLEKHPDPHMKMLIVGGGPDLKRLQGIVSKKALKDRILFAGSVPPGETKNYYHLGDVCVFASKTETQGLTLLEALGSSLICLANEDEPIKKVIVDAENGFLFKNKEEYVESLFKIRHLSVNERKNITENGYKSLREYSLDKFYSSIIEVYAGALNE